MATCTPCAVTAAANTETRAAELTALAPAPDSPAPASGSDDASGHEDTAGLKLVAQADGNDPPGTTCVAGAFVRDEHIAAVAVDITVNRYGDHDPRGRMFAFEDELGRVRDEERRNADARANNSKPAVTAGLQGDAIQRSFCGCTPASVSE